MFRIALSLLLSITISFAEIEWISSLKKAKEISLQTKKPILIFVATKTCPYCIEMKSTVLTDRDVVSYISNNFVPFLLYPSTGQFPKNANIEGVPTLMFYDAQEKKLAPNIVGLIEKDELLENLKGLNLK